MELGAPPFTSILVETYYSKSLKSHADSFAKLLLFRLDLSGIAQGFHALGLFFSLSPLSLSCIYLKKFSKEIVPLCSKISEKYVVLSMLKKSLPPCHREAVTSPYFDIYNGDVKNGPNVARL